MMVSLYTKQNSKDVSIYKTFQNFQSNFSLSCERLFLSFSNVLIECPDHQLFWYGAGSRLGKTK